jgi:hypothetical protein
VNRNTQIVFNDDLLRKIVYCIEKAVKDDLQQYLRESHRETNNAVILLRGDNINTNLRNHVAKDDIELIPFRRYGWSGRMIVDRKDHITYSIMTEETLSGIPKKKNRENPHYSQSLLYVENKDCLGKSRQMTLEDFGIKVFNTDVLEQDFEKISQGMINVEENYRHYIIAYKAKNGEIKDIKLKFLDKDFNMIDEKSLIQYIKPDFARLTDIGTVDVITNKDMKTDKKSLVAIRSGIKPKLRKIKKKS